VAPVGYALGFPLVRPRYTVMPDIRTHAPRGAFVFDTRRLGRQAGAALTQTRTVPAPDDLRLELVRVPVDADVRLDLRFEAVTAGVLVTGTATAPVTGECARCLAPLASSVTASLTELYRYDDRRGRDRPGPYGGHSRRDGHGRAGEEEAGEPDEDERRLDGDLLDLEPAFRDAVVLALPMSPLCRDDCPGLCVQCGVPLAEAGPDHGHEDAPDPRWAKLARHDLTDEHDQVPDRRARAINRQEG
jgi:uncharacterized protein